MTRSRRIAFAALISLGMATPVHAAEVPTVELIGYRSGFAKARLDRVTITVGPLPDYPNQPWFDSDHALDAGRVAAIHQ